MDKQRLLKLYRWMFSARISDETEASLARQGEAPFYIPTAGHEGIAALGLHFLQNDWLECHYRDKALAIARGVSLKSYYDSLLGNDESNSAGRRMPGFVSDRTLNILSSPTVVGSSSLHAVGVADVIKDHPDAPFVYCGAGDGGTQEGEFLEALAEVSRSCLPVLFVIQDNHFALSTPTTGKMFYSSADGGIVNSFMNITVSTADGSQPHELEQHFQTVVQEIRSTRKPHIAVVDVQRLTSHTNSDDQRVYRSAEEIERIQKECDPVLNLKIHLLANGIQENEISGIEDEVREENSRALQQARESAEPRPAAEALRPLPDTWEGRKEYRGDINKPALTLIEAMREAFRHQLQTNPNVTMNGEDIEDPKGDVFGLTRGLSTDFPGRVTNAPLAEATILGKAIGQAMAGRQPVAMMQFVDFMPPAYNQLVCELGCMYWRTKGEWETPVLITAISGGYRAGLGPFHAQSPDGMAAQIPGVDVIYPSTAGDAAGLINAVFEAGRPTLLLYPKTLLNDRSLMTSNDISDHFVPLGKAREVRKGDHLTIVTWGSTVPLCMQTAKVLDQVGVYVQVIDLRSIKPWDKDCILNACRKTGKLLVVHEDNQVCGMGGEIVATVSEELGSKVQVARLGRKDTYIPYHYGEQLNILPSFKTILEKAATMTGYSVTWKPKSEENAGKLTVNAMGSSPSDETVTVTQLHVQPGDRVKAGTILASVEANKAAMEISTPVDGTVDTMLLNEGDVVQVGTALAVIATDGEAPNRMMHGIDPGTPLLSREIEQSAGAAKEAAADNPPRASGEPVYLNSVCSAVGSRVMKNEEFLHEFPQWTSDDVRKRTGIEQRYWISEDENALTLGVKAARELLEREKLEVQDLDMIICSTGTPPSSMTPSLACRILKELSPEDGEVMVQAYDINAACTGYLYSLQAAYDTLKYDASRKIMIVTAEALSPMVNRKDPHTAFIFGDAATASLLTTERRGGNMHARIHRPVLSAMGVDEHILRVPFLKTGETIEMEGPQVFRVAVRKMVDMLDNACKAEAVTIDQLDMIVTHQANERIIEAARKMIKFPKERVFNQMREYGNTSSNTIPLALQTVIPNQASGDKIGLTAFGGGYTFGAAIIEAL